MNDLYYVNVANFKTIINDKTKLFTVSRAEINVVHHHLFQHYKDNEQNKSFISRVTKFSVMCPSTVLLYNI